jgi:hypothetical protein
VAMNPYMTSQNAAVSSSTPLRFAHTHPAAMDTPQNTWMAGWATIDGIVEA